MQRRFVLIKDFKTRDGIIPKGTELTIFRGGMYVNGGMCHPAYSKELFDLIELDSEVNFFLKEIQIINNKV